MSKKVFTEEQRFNQWWLWLLMLATAVVVTYAFISNYDSSTEYWFGLAIGPGITLIVIYFLYSIKLITRIDEYGITAKLSPIVGEKKFLWSEIESIEVVHYRPLLDYGGWGYRVGFGGRGTALNIRGNVGIKLQTKAGKKFMIGTQKEAEAKAIIEAYQTKSES